MNRLKQLRKAKGLTQEELANTLHVTERTISRWENGINELSGSASGLLAIYFNVSQAYLLGYSDNPDVVKLKEGEIIVNAKQYMQYKQAYELLNGLRGFLNE
ncbi:Repressor LexA [Streptococcus parauberis]|uniref:helix-turn-helix domain-containing protein n=1 Tax=Streptococcus parauberis TaxID=1348 RepID=UPI0002FE2312|nr:helix-turn-helix transcriptional regulator [Streptococcus parauberis]AUT06246.1 Repressor LexA [Streptococcus parauberis]QBX17969.1 DNA-binding protein [Streptococcus phage Javan389]UWV09638.1 helix-turn-helix domain-containing protein [Streptococcus parauberis]WEM62028.1 helix-turn-helix transcriptional regulator [Streptococcus parauberis]